MPDGSMGQIGGRTVYPNKHESGDFNVSSESGLRNALDQASSGDVVFIDGSATIDLGGDRITIPSGVTLASDRGVGSSNGATLRGYESEPAVIRNRGTIEGVEVAGPVPDFLGYDDRYRYGSARGIECYDGSEVANCHVHNYTDGGIHLSGASNVHIHHCEVSDHAVEGVGYGITANSGGGESGRVVIEYCFMHTCRHEIAAHGGSGYILRHNVFGEDQFTNPTGNLQQQDVDDHGVGLHTIHNNEFRKTGEIFSFRDGVESGTECYRNWFWDSDPDGIGDFPSSGVYENHYGPSDPPEGVGANYDDVSEPPPDPTGTVFSVVTPDGGSEVTFSFTADGQIFRHEVSDTVSSVGESNVSITDNGDGTWTGTGASGNGFGDAFLVDGNVIEYSDNGAARTLRWDGQEVTASDLVGDGDGNGDTDPPEECTYQGYDRSEWGYSGTETDDFNAWQACDITTDQFQQDTAMGNGTAALIHPDDVNGDDPPPQEGSGLNAGILLVAGLGYAAYRAARGRNR